MDELVFEVKSKPHQVVDDTIEKQHDQVGEPVGIVFDDRDKLRAGGSEEGLTDGNRPISPGIQPGVLTFRTKTLRPPQPGGRARRRSTPEVETEFHVALIGLPEHIEDRHRLHVVGERSTLVRLVTRARESYFVRILRFGRFRRGLPAALCTLTDAQLSALRTAHSLGYYDIPRKAGTASVAQVLKMHKGSAGDHLRRAERKVFDELLRGPSQPRPKSPVT